MAELLILAADTGSTDTINKWYGANIVDVQDDGHIWGREEGPPIFFILKVPGVSKSDAEEYISEWRHNPTYALVNSQPAQDAYRIRLDSTAVSVSGKGAITLAQVQSFFTRWGCTVKSTTSKSVTFDTTIFDILTSEGFWGLDVSGITFTEIEYNNTTGSHLIEVGIGPTDAQIQQVCQRESVVYVAPRSFIATRAEARQKMQDEIADRFREIGIARRRWFVSAAGMTALQNAGGILSVTPAQFVANITDGLTV